MEPERDKRMSKLTDRELLDYAIKELDRICMGAVDYNYPQDEKYVVYADDVGRVLRVLKGWDEPAGERHLSNKWSSDGKE